MVTTSIWEGSLRQSPLADKAVQVAGMIFAARPMDRVKRVIVGVLHPRRSFGGNIRVLRLWSKDDVRDFLSFHLVLKSASGRARNRRQRLHWLTRVTERTRNTPLVLYGTFDNDSWRADSNTPDGYVQAICLTESHLDRIIEELRNPGWGIKFINI